MLTSEELTLGRVDLAPHSVEVDRVKHHAVVDEHERQPFAVAKPQWLCLRELLSIEGPHEPSHVAGEVQHDLAAGFA